MNRKGYIALLFLTLGVAACNRGPQMAPVTGVVLLNGQPVEGAAVLFTPEAGGRPADGVTDKEGKFTLQTFAPGDGAVIGKHKVAFIGMRMTGVQATSDGLSGEVNESKAREVWFVPKKYASPDTSGLEAEVKRNMEPLKFELTGK
jgi:hypothetical protein